MQIAILGRNIRPPWNEAVKNMAYELARRLSLHGHDVHLISNDSKEIPEQTRLYIHSVPTTSFVAGAKEKVTQLNAAGKIDLIHIQNLLIHRSLAGLVESFKKSTRLPIVSYCCQLPALSISEWLKVARKDPREAFSSKLGMLAPDFVTKSAMKNIDMTLTSSHYIQKHLSKPENQDRDKVIHPFVSADQINLPRTSIPTKGRKLQVLYVGSHKVLRGEDDFLRITARLRHKTPTLKARAVTNYPIPGRIKRLVEKLELGETVEFLPREVQLNMQELMQESDLYVFTGLPPVGAIDPPLTIIESQIFGTPVLSYDAAGISEVLGPENLVRYGDVKALADLARDVLEKPASREPRPDLLQRYGSEKAAKQFEGFYEKLV